MSDIGESLERFGSSLMNLGVVAYRVDARSKFSNESLAIATDIEDFKQSLLRDPEPGNPWKRDGYMQRWDEFKKDIEKRVEKIDNPLAKRELKEFWGKTNLMQETEIRKIQYEKWRDEEITNTTKRIEVLVDTSGLDTQQLLEETNKELSFLKYNGIIEDSQNEQLMDNYARTIIGRDISSKAKQIFDETQGDIIKAKKYIEGFNETYSAGGKIYTAGDKEKKYANEELLAHYKIAQEEDNAMVQEAFANFYLAFEEKAKKGVPHFNAELIQSTRLSPDRKMYWLSQLDGLNNPNDLSLKTKGHQVMNGIAAVAYAVASSVGKVGEPAKVLVGVDEKGRPEHVPASVRQFENMVAKNMAILQNIPGSMEKIAELRKMMTSTDLGILKDVFEKIDKAKLPDNQRIELKAYLEWYYRNHPGIGVDQILEVYNKAKDTKYSTLQMTAGLIYGNRFIKDDDDKIVFNMWDKVYKNHVGASMGELPRPIFGPTRDTLMSFEAGFLKTALSLAGINIDPTTGGLPDNVRASWAPMPDDPEVLEPVVAIMNNKGEWEQYRAVPLVDQAGNRLEATVLRSSLEGPTGKKESKIELYDPGKKQWATVSPLEKKNTGWSLPKGWESDKPPEQYYGGKEQNRLEQIEDEMGNLQKIIDDPKASKKAKKNAKDKQSKLYKEYESLKIQLGGSP
jgi:hypothetical protein